MTETASRTDRSAQGARPGRGIGTAGPREADPRPRPDIRELRTRERFRELGALEGAARRRVQEAIVLDHLDVVDRLVHRLAPRYRDQGDLRQVGCIGLINAVHRFDAERGDDFLAFAVPTISGEIKRYLRDQGWFVRPPRRVQELRLALVAAEAELAQRLQHEPSTAEFAEQLHVDRRAVSEAVRTPTSLRPVSLDTAGVDDDATIGSTIGGVDPELDLVDVRIPVRRAIACLSERERRIVYLRFFEERTQSEIAADIGVTQMQVSRLLTRILATLQVLLAPQLVSVALQAAELSA
jgi:RNA polymerase sigma-B factor